MLLAFLLLKVTVKSSEEPHSARERRRARPWIGAPLPPEVIYVCGVCVCVAAASDAIKKKKKKGNIRLEDGETRRSQSFGRAVYFCLLNVAALAGRSHYRFTGEWEACMAGLKEALG